MRIKPLALASACLLALSAHSATAGLDFSEEVYKHDHALALHVPLPTVDTLAQHGLSSLDSIKSRVNSSGVTYVAQSEAMTKSDVTTQAAVAQLGTPADKFSYGLVGILLVLIAGGFMWLSLMQQRRED